MNTTNTIHKVFFKAAYNNNNIIIIIILMTKKPGRLLVSNYVQNKVM